MVPFAHLTFLHVCLHCRRGGQGGQAGGHDQNAAHPHCTVEGESERQSKEDKEKEERDRRERRQREGLDEEDEEDGAGGGGGGGGGTR